MSAIAAWRMGSAVGTSCSFGGTNLATLLITTASIDLALDIAETAPLAGSGSADSQASLQMDVDPVNGSGAVRGAAPALSRPSGKDRRLVGRLLSAC